MSFASLDLIANDLVISIPMILLLIIKIMALTIQNAIMVVNENKILNTK